MTKISNLTSNIRQYIVNAFTDQPFSGNPAAVIVFDDNNTDWPDDLWMLQIAKQNNLSETAFAMLDTQSSKGNHPQYHLRWFTPGGEIDLCGHATLATAFIIANFINVHITQIDFITKSGLLSVTCNQDLFTLNFPAYPLEPVTITEHIIDLIGVTPEALYLGRDLLCIVEDESIVEHYQPNPEKLCQLNGLLLHLSARSQRPSIDISSRSFAPKLGVIEDPVCGSGHCHIIPYWADTLQQTEITAYQASERTGILYTKLVTSPEPRVLLGGKAQLFSIAKLIF